MKKIIGIFVGILLFWGASPSFVYATEQLIPEHFINLQQIQELTGMGATNQKQEKETQPSKKSDEKKSTKKETKQGKKGTTDTEPNKDETCKSKDKHIETAHYDTTTKKCVIDKCQKDYEIKDNKCVSKDKLAKQAEKDKKKADKEATRAKTALEKEYASDVKSLVDAFNTVVNKIVTKCKSEGKTIVDGECKESGDK